MLKWKKEKKDERRGDYSRPGDAVCGNVLTVRRSPVSTAEHTYPTLPVFYFYFSRRLLFFFFLPLIIDLDSTRPAAVILYIEFCLLTLSFLGISNFPF